MLLTLLSYTSFALTYFKVMLFINAEGRKARLAAVHSK